MASETPKSVPLETYYFCDESSFFVGEKFMGVGGLAIRKENIPIVNKRLREIRAEKKALGEIKWRSTSRLNVGARIAYVDYMAELIQKNCAQLHIRLSPWAEYNHDGPRREFDTVSKAYYQLLVHRAARYYGKEYKIRVRPDDGECTAGLERFGYYVGNEAGARYGVDPCCIEDIVCLSSENEPLLQFLDVSLGALTACRNGRHVDEAAAKHKRDLANHALKSFAQFGLKETIADCDNGNRFSIWNVRPLMKKRGPGS